MYTYICRYSCIVLEILNANVYVYVNTYTIPIIVPYIHTIPIIVPYIHIRMYV